MKVTYIQHCGDDLAIVNAARVSFKKKSGWCVVDHGEWYEEVLDSSDAKLISYLAKHNHHSPFNHTFLTMHVKAPIFVARQLVKHKFMPINEVSRRYVDDDPEFYQPDLYRLRAENVKQGSSNKTYTPCGNRANCPFCGEEFISTGNKQIYCSQKCQAKSYRSNEGWVTTKLSSLKQSANTRGIVFDLQTLEMPTHCRYLGLELDYSANRIQDNSPSVDRIDNNLGYVEGNVQVISNKANIMKHNASQEELRQFAKKILTQSGYFIKDCSDISEYYEEMKNLYRKLIKEGMAPEMARGFMPQSLMTEWYWSGTLGAWADMYKLRIDGHAQWETQQIAKQVGEIIEPLFPVAWKALVSE